MKLILFMQPSTDWTDWLAYLLEPALRSLALGCLAWLVLAVLPVKRAAARLYAWTGLLYVALAMPLLGALLPPVKVAVPGVSAAPIAQRVSPLAEVDAKGGTATKAESNSGTAQANAQRSRLPASSSKPESASLSSPVTGPTQPRLAAILWRAARKIIAPAIYLVGLVILLSRLLLGALWARRLARSAQDISARYFSAQDDIENF
jgi:hypothetical protein